MTTPSGASLRFDVHPSVVFRLGEELVTDPIQAIVELAKNSYDAGSTKVTISICTTKELPPGSRLKNKTSYLLMQDFGSGMTRDQLVRGWLVIANSYKRDLKRSNKIPPTERTPLGDKGLGRLGVQKIGRRIEVITRSASDPNQEHYLAFDWAQFEKAQTLGEVKVEVTTKRGWSTDKPGTTILISDLKDIDFWSNPTAVDHLAADLSKMLTPYSEIRTCRVSLRINGVSVPLLDVTKKVREAAPVRYFLKFDGETFSVRGVVSLDFFRPRAQARQELVHFERFCSSDRGVALFKYFRKDKAITKSIPGLARIEDGLGFIEFNRVWTWKDLDGVKASTDGPISPGPFSGEVNFISFDNKDPNLALDKKSEIQNSIKGIEGVRLFRNGFGIRVDEDWLELGKAWTGGPSYYGLKPANVFGYIALSARGNPMLQETTSREGLIKNSESENFLRLLSAFVEFANKTQSKLRRTFNDFIGEARSSAVGVSDQDDTDTVIGRLKESAKALSKAHGSLSRRSSILKGQTGQSNSKTKGKLPASEASPNELEPAIQLVAEANKHVDEFITIQDVLKRREIALREEIASMYETVSLGITAEVLAHEINHIADDLNSRTADILKYCAKQKITDLRLLAFLEHIRGSATGLRKQLAFLTPSLKYVRERRETIGMVAFVNHLVDHYRNRFEGTGIQFNISKGSHGDFSIGINRGKLNQVFENLLINSQYWVSEALNSKQIKAGVISIVIDKPFVRISDNGPGIDPAVEESIFDPFVSTKRAGRGLGLFVVKQLLDSENCSMYLLQERNKSKRQYVFQIDFKGAMNAHG